MYCVKCGVRLGEGTERCPLCGTPVWKPTRAAAEKSYPEELPRHTEESTKPLAAAATALSVMAALIILIICLKKYGEMRWGEYVLSGIGLAYVLFVLPAWFRRPPPEVFVPADHAAIALFLLYMCVKTGGSWFLPFAFPVTGGSCLLLTALTCLLKYVRGGRPVILGGFSMLLGGFTLLVEFLETVAFGTEMFQWSLYTLAVFGILGVFLLLCGLIPALHHHLKKRFFY